MRHVLKKIIKTIIPNKFKPAIKRIYSSRVNQFNKNAKHHSKVVPSSYSGKLNHYILADTKHINVMNVLYVFPVIDWGFRFQRPQHFARGFARQDYKVFYFTTSFTLADEPGYIINNIESNVFEVRLNANCEINIYTQNLQNTLKDFWLQSLAKFEAELGIIDKLIKLDHPFWIDLAKDLNGKIIYDCMDDHEGFEDGLDHIIELEQKAIKACHILVVSADKLYQKFASKHHNCVLIENACDYDFFSQVKNLNEVELLKDKLQGKGVIGYFGAIANWFDLECLNYLVYEFPDYDFVLIGHTHGCEDANQLSTRTNVYLLGEKPYSVLPSYLALFDICLIPFKIIPLTLATNPVKMFEYLSQGKPVVATSLPEIEKYSEVVYTALDKFEFKQKVIQAFIESDNLELIANRIKVAKNNSWDQRFTQLTNFIRTTPSRLPKVSVVILTYNNLNLTKNCLYSLYKYSHYDNLEIIIVDNLSSDGSREWLTDYARDKINVKLILNNTNAGFSKGNNIGIKQATGDYIVILNNDTFVSPGWIHLLLRHFDDSLVGMVGPVTNNIGNQAKIELPSYFTEAKFVYLATLNYYNNRGKIYNLTQGSLAFFCVVISRAVFDMVGALDETFGRGWFEDDDYNIRVRNAGYKTLIADDVLVHHEHSASFGKLPQEEKLALFERNQLYFEQKHNMKWIPHVTDR